MAENFNKQNKDWQLKLGVDLTTKSGWIGRTFLWMVDRNAAKEQYRILEGLDTRLTNALFDFIYRE